MQGVLTVKSPQEFMPKESAEEMREMFLVSASATSPESQIDERVSEIVREFLSTMKISTDVDLSTLMDGFKNSRFPLEATEVESYINYLAENVVAHSIHTSSPRFIGHMTAALPYFMRPLGRLLTAMNQNLVKMETAKVLSFYERQTLAMIHRVIYDFPDEFYDHHIQQSSSSLGIMLSGGTLANVTALWCARNTALGPKDDFKGVEHEGLPAALKFYGYRDAVIIGSALAHYSINKAVGVLGLGTRNLIQVPVDRNNQVDPDALRQTVEECQARKDLIVALIGVAGTTDSGAIDPLPAIGEIARANNLYFHVDAAWGGPLLLSATHRHKLAGIDLADSVTIDGHKQLYAPMGVGMLLLRDPHMAKSIEKHARYIVRAKSIDLGKRALEGSRPAMALFLHAALHILGHRGYEMLVDHGISKTRYLAKRVHELPEFELLIEPPINIVVYRYIPEPWRAKAARKELTELENQSINRINEQLQKIQRQKGLSFVSRTTLETTSYGRGLPIVALRAVIANFLTTEFDIDAVLCEQMEIASQIV